MTLLDLSSGLLTFAQFGHKDNVDAKVCTVLFYIVLIISSKLY